MPEENQEGSAYGDISSKESVDGLVVPTTNPFYPNIEFRYSDDGDFEGYKVDFNQGYIFNRVSATQVDDIGDTGICARAAPRVVRQLKVDNGVAILRNQMLHI